MVINLDNVLQIRLEAEPKDPTVGTGVVVEFLMRGMDELEGGQNFTEPYLAVFEGEEAEALRKYLKKTCPDLLTHD
jgi:hypothetical protein